jgi:photosystem II stability/assembly factor-like uncharacterized protein
MRSIVGFSIFILLLISSVLYSQGSWYSQNVNSTNHLHSIYFPSPNTGYIAGWSSEVIKTTDGGNNWIHLNCTLSVDIQYLFFVNNDLGWLVGGSGKIGKTTNGGLTWTSQYSGISDILYQTFFINVSTGLIVGAGGHLLKTTNAGVNWNILNSGTSNNLTGISFKDNTVGYIVGDVGTVIKTTNSGDNWFFVNPGVTNNFSKMFFLNSNTGWITGYNGIIIKTTTGGGSWILQPSGVTTWIIQPYFVSPNTGWVVGNQGLILKTINGGDNWTLQTSNTVNDLRCNYFLNEYTGFAVGFNGTVLKTTTGGVSYVVQGFARYSDNNQPITSGYIKAVRLNKSDGSIIVVDSAQIQTDGSYILPHVTGDTVDIGLYPNSTTQNDYVVTHYPSTPYWERAILLAPSGNISNLNIGAIRMYPVTANNSVNGKVMRITNTSISNVKDAVLYAKLGNNYVRCGVTDGNGVYHLPSLPTGTLKIIANRFGYSGDSTTVNVTPLSNIDSINFYLRYLYIGISKIESVIPSYYSLYQNYPNPFNPTTNIRYQITNNKLVTLKIYDILGKEVATLVNEKQSPGVYEVTFDGSGMSSGIYFYTLSAGDFKATKRFVLVK